MITTAHPRITDLRGCFYSVVQELALCQGTRWQKVTPVLKNNGKIFQTKFFQKEVTKALRAYNAVYKWWNMKGENRRTCVYHPFYFVCLFFVVAFHSFDNGSLYESIDRLAVLFCVAGNIFFLFRRQPEVNTLQLRLVFFRCSEKR